MATKGFGMLHDWLNTALAVFANIDIQKVTTNVDHVKQMMPWLFGAGKNDERIWHRMMVRLVVEQKTGEDLRAQIYRLYKILPPGGAGFWARFARRRGWNYFRLILTGIAADEEGKKKVVTKSPDGNTTTTTEGPVMVDRGIKVLADIARMMITVKDDAEVLRRLVVHCAIKEDPLAYTAISTWAKAMLNLQDLSTSTIWNKLRGAAQGGGSSFIAKASAAATSADNFANQSEPVIQGYVDRAMPYLWWTAIITLVLAVIPIITYYVLRG